MFQSYEDVYTKDSKYGRNSIGFDNANGARLYARFRAWETAAQREAESDSGIVRTYYPVVIKGMPTDGRNTGSRIRLRRFQIWSGFYYTGKGIDYPAI